MQGWEWVEETWQIDMKGLQEAAIDEDGWSYATDFGWIEWPPKPGTGRFRKVRDYVRRRRWYRTRVFSGIPLHEASPSPVKLPPASKPPTELQPQQPVDEKEARSVKNLSPRNSGSSPVLSGKPAAAAGKLPKPSILSAPPPRPFPETLLDNLAAQPAALWKRSASQGSSSGQTTAAKPRKNPDAVANAVLASSLENLSAESPTGKPEETPEGSTEPQEKLSAAALTKRRDSAESAGSSSAAPRPAKPSETLRQPRGKPETLARASEPGHFMDRWKFLGAKTDEEARSDIVTALSGGSEGKLLETGAAESGMAQWMSKGMSSMFGGVALSSLRGKKDDVNLSRSMDGNRPQLARESAPHEHRGHLLLSSRRSISEELQDPLSASDKISHIIARQGWDRGMVRRVSEPDKAAEQGSSSELPEHLSLESNSPTSMINEVTEQPLSSKSAHSDNANSQSRVAHQDLPGPQLPASAFEGPYDEIGVTLSDATSLAASRTALEAARRAQEAAESAAADVKELAAESPVSSTGATRFSSEMSVSKDETLSATSKQETVDPKSIDSDSASSSSLSQSKDTKPSRASEPIQQSSQGSLPALLGQDVSGSSPDVSAPKDLGRVEANKSLQGAASRRIEQTIESALSAPSSPRSVVSSTGATIGSSQAPDQLKFGASHTEQLEDLTELGEQQIAEALGGSPTKASVLDAHF